MTTAIATRDTGWVIETRHARLPDDWQRGDVVYLRREDGERMLATVRDFADVFEVRLVEVRVVRAL